MADDHCMVAHDQHLMEDIAIVREGSKEAFPGRQAAVLSRNRIVGGIDKYVIIRH
jgi:hypothetical protein